MAREIINTALYYRKPTKEEIEAGVPKSKKTYITVPVKEVFLGVNETCGAMLKSSIVRDSLRYYFACVNFAETL